MAAAGPGPGSLQQGTTMPHFGNGWFGPLHHRGQQQPAQRSGRKRSKKQHAAGAGQQQQDFPSLQQLQKENKIKTKRHYRGGGGGGSRGRQPLGWSVPRAPERESSFLPMPGSVRRTQGFHSITPAAAGAEAGAWLNGLGTIDPQAAEIGAAAGIDMFGSNAGIITRGGEHSAEESHDEDDPFGFELHVEESPAAAIGDLPAAVRQRMEEQAAYICQLEETNLKLQERIYLLEQQCEQGDNVHGDGGDGDEQMEGEDEQGDIGARSGDEQQQQQRQPQQPQQQQLQPGQHQSEHKEEHRSDSHVAVSSSGRHQQHRVVGGSDVEGDDDAQSVGSHSHDSGDPMRAN